MIGKSNLQTNDKKGEHLSLCWKKDPKELNNVYDDPQYAEVQARLHQELQTIREKYGDSDAISQQYIDVFMDDVEKNGIFGVNETRLQEIIAKRKTQKQ